MEHSGEIMSDEILSELVDLAYAGVKRAKRYNAKESEIFVRRVHATEIISSNNGIIQANAYDDSGANVRLYMRRAIGGSFTNDLSEDSLYKIIKQATWAAEASQAIKNWPGFPEGEKIANRDMFWRNEVNDANPCTLISISEDIRNALSQSSLGIHLENLSVIAYSNWEVGVNTSGLHVEKRETGVKISANAFLKGQDWISPAIFTTLFNRGLDIDISKISQDFIDDLKLFTNIQKFETKSTKLILSENALGWIFEFSLIPAIHGANIVRGRSNLGSQLGQQLISDKLSIIDDGLHPDGFRSSAFDGEGLPHKRFSIFEKGVLKSFIWNHYWANRYNTKSTANAIRDYRKSHIGILPTNLVIEPGDATFDEMISSISEGIYVHNVMGAFGANPATGDFHVILSPAYLIKNGEIKGAIIGAAIAGNIWKLLNSVEMVGKEQRVSETLIGPPVLFDNVTIQSHSRAFIPQLSLGRVRI